MLGGQASLLEQIRLGSIQFATLPHSGFGTVVPVAQITNVGFAFNSDQQPLQAMDGPLGAYIVREIAAKGMHLFPRSTASGFRQLTSSTKPIRNADDLVGFKLRVAPTAIFVDLFKSLGASPVALDANELYTAMQTHIVDGQENNLGSIEGFKVYEVQRYLSITNHMWNGSWLAANPAAWNSLPSDMQAVVERNVAQYVPFERRQITLQTASLADKLKRQGMIFNTADAASMRARLGGFYQRWKDQLGATPWGLLEATVGKLG
jgi:tripartite ATP-independent transporter DctP family solute receptor